MDMSALKTEAEMSHLAQITNEHKVVFVAVAAIYYVLFLRPLFNQYAARLCPVETPLFFLISATMSHQRGTEATQASL